MEHGHDGPHKYTPKGLLSPSVIEKLVNELTSGGLTSRAGLDNIYVEKGVENFQTLRELARTLSYHLINDNKKEKLEDILQHINDIEEYHKVNFERHLQESTENMHVCMCFHCGFHDEKKDPIICMLDHKNYPCKDCQNSFTIFKKMDSLLNEVENRFNSSDVFFDENPTLQDDLLGWRTQIEHCERNLVAFRAHLVQKVSESAFDKENEDLDENECLCVIDYKMKVLPKSFREKMIDWYSKRGISVLGVEMHMKVNGERKAFYHFFISDDTNQDTDAVCCAKHFLYSKIFPRYGVKTVRFRCDGGACFASNDAKAAMKVWKEIADEALEEDRVSCFETMYKVMVAGCGKTALDGKIFLLIFFLFQYIFLKEFISRLLQVCSEL